MKLTKLPPPAKLMPIILLSMISALSFNTYGQNWNTGANNSIHNSNTGNVGIGITVPERKLEIYNVDSVSIRLSTHNNYYNTAMCKADLTYYWDIQNTGSLNFNSYHTTCGDPTSYLKTMQITPAGQLILGGTNPDASAIMQIESTEKGLLIPRMTTNQKNAISSPANALLVYDTNLKAFSYYDISSGTWLNTAISSELSDYLMISDFNNSVAGGILQSDTANWNTAYNFSQNFIESDPIFTAWDKDYNDLTNKPDLFDGNWGSLSGTVPNISIFINDVGYITEADINSLWQEDENGNVYRENGFVGIGTESPSKTLDIQSFDNHLSGDPTKKSTIRLLNESRYSKGIPGPGPTPSPKIYKWDIENNNDTLDINYISYDPDNIGGNVIPVTKFSLSGNGTLTATNFVGDGSELTNLNLPEEIWQQNGNDIYYDEGNVGIGTTAPDEKLTVKGTIKCRKVKVSATAGADFVFNSDYKLITLDNLEKFVKTNKHLPEIPTANEMQTEGLDLGENNIKLLQKIEELTLYIIELNKANRKLKERILKFENK